MASIQETIRQPRISTKLSTFSNGMYLTHQQIPDGYAKILVNYDIDDTGSYLRPRRGLEVTQNYSVTSPSVGPITLTDYLYVYNSALTDVIDIMDVVMSHGKYTSLTVSYPGVDIPARMREPIYVGHMINTVDTNMYDDYGVVVTPGTITKTTINNAWAMYWDKSTFDFKPINNTAVGYVTARTVRQAYAFDKELTEDVGRPIGTVLNNELIAFTGPTISYSEFPNDEAMSSFTTLDTPSLSKVLISKSGSNVSLIRQVIDPNILNVTEAATTGYNILSSSPYTFQDTDSGSIAISGLLLYTSASGTALPIFTPTVGEPVSVRVYYQYPTITSKVQMKVEYLNNTSASSDWQIFQDWKDMGNTGTPLWYSFTPKDTQFLIRVTIRLGSDTTTEYPMTKAYDTSSDKYKNLQNKVFDLSTCKGMVTWLGCVGVYGVENAKDSIFFSDIEDPSYFPFPNNVLAFDNEILAVHNYLDYILVVTVDSLWIVESAGSISTSSSKRVMTNIYIPEIDAINMVVLKDQVFFKTDTQFYVLKPNVYTADATNLKNYTNSTALANYTLDFTKETLNVLNAVYKSVRMNESKRVGKDVNFDNFDVIDTVSHVRNEEVHYIYTIKPYIGEAFFGRVNVHFVYNSMARTWRMYLKPIGNTDVQYNPVLYRNKQSGYFYEFYPHKNVSGVGSVVTIAMQTYNTVSDNIKQSNWNLSNYYNNFPYIDTGNVSIDDTMVKRFRELQLNMVNKDTQRIGFSLDFKVDGAEVVKSTSYSVETISDKQDPAYGTVFVTPTEVENLQMYGDTQLGNNASDDKWQLDLSAFTELDMVTLRIELIGRGRRGSIQLLNTSLKDYQLSNWTWVYRPMKFR